MVKLVSFYIFADKQLNQLKADALTSQANSAASGTFNNYINHWVNYLQFCIYFALRALPTSVSIMIWFVQHMSTQVSSPKTVRAAVSAVKKLHLILNQNIQGCEHHLLTMTLQGITRLSQHVESQAAPVTPQILEQIYQVLDVTKEEDAIFWAVCVFAFFLLFRKSNLVPDTKYGFLKSHQLAREDLVFTPENVIVGIRWAKTSQFAKKLMTYPLPILPGSILCPKTAIDRVFQLVEGSDGDHIFMTSSGSSYTYRMFQTKLRWALAAAGVPDPARFSSHSFRRGGATFAFLCGVPAEIIKILGSWKSDVYIQYLHLPFEARLAASQLMKLRLMYRSYEY